MGTTTTTTTTACVSVCSCSDSDFTMSGSSCFYVSTDTATQADAVTACEAKGAILATISDASQQTDVAAMISADAWIGLNDIAVDETFVWQDDSTASYTNWYGTSNPISPANTNVNCVKMQFSQSGQWNDIGCGKELNYVCSMMWLTLALMLQRLEQQQQQQLPQLPLPPQQHLQQQRPLVGLQEIPPLLQEPLLLGQPDIKESRREVALEIGGFLKMI